MNFILKLFRRITGAPTTLVSNTKVKNDPYHLGNTPLEVLETILGQPLHEHELFKDRPGAIKSISNFTTEKQVLDFVEFIAMEESSHLKTLPANIAGIFKRRGITDSRIRLSTKKNKVMYQEKIIFDTPLRHKDGNEWCHLVSYDIEYLKQFAVTIGLKSKWIQKSNKGYIHFDIKSDRIRQAAKKLGAVQVERKYLRRYLDHHFPSMIHL
jgi:hypothetical protein